MHAREASSPLGRKGGWRLTGGGLRIAQPYAQEHLVQGDREGPLGISTQSSEDVDLLPLQCIPETIMNPMNCRFFHRPFIKMALPQGVEVLEEWPLPVNREGEPFAASVLLMALSQGRRCSKSGPS